MQHAGSHSARLVMLALLGFVGAATFSVAGRGVSAQQGTGSGLAARPSESGQASSSRGRTVYDSHCVECHGRTGKGDGPAALTLVPHPRDFTSGRYKIRSTETGSLPTDDDLLRSVRRGLPGSAMPGWETLLPAEDIRAVVSYIKTFSPRFAAEAPEPIVPSVLASPSPESATRGAAVYAVQQCGKCHGDDGRGTGAVVTSFQDDWGFPLRATDLTEPWTFHGGASPEDIYMRFRAGISGTPMPSYKGTATDREMADLANYVVSLRRKPLWEMNAEEVGAFYRRQEAEALADPVKRGAYLVDTMACSVCHSPVDEQKRMLPGMRLAGGMRLHIAPFGTYPTGNLTSDKETGLGNWTDEEIARVITRGILKDGTRLLPYPMDWPSFSTMKASDVSAIVAYLRTVPPVRNKVPPPSRTVLPLFLWGKFNMLLLGGDPPMTFYAGNAGSASAVR